MKKHVTRTHVLRGLEWNLSFHISIDVADISIGVVLGQQEGNKPYAIYYVSKNLGPIEVNYTIIEKEFLFLYMLLINLGIMSLVTKILFIHTIQLSGS